MKTWWIFEEAGDLHICSERELVPNYYRAEAIPLVEASAYDFMKKVADGCSEREKQTHIELNLALKQRDALMEYKAVLENEGTQDWIKTIKERDEALKWRNENFKSWPQIYGQLEFERSRSAKLVEALRYVASYGPGSDVAQKALAEFDTPTVSKKDET